MSDFEYLRSVNLGQYIATGSPIHRLDPRARLIAGLLLLAAITFTPRLPGVLFGLALALLLLILARIPLGFATRSLLPPLPFLLFLAVLQVIFPPHGAGGPILLQISWVRLSLDGVLSGITLLLRFAALILTLSLTSFCISTSELTHGLESLLSPLERLGLPTGDLVMSIQVMLRFIPFLAQSAEQIAKAQASRGADWGTRRGGPISRVKQAFPVIIPLFLTGLRKAENLALAMEARGYGSTGKRTSMIEMRFHSRDGVALAIATLLAAGIVLI